MKRPSRLLLAGAALAVLVSSADTYVIVIVITSIMTDIGINVEHLQQATPIVSGFLLGYVVALPLLGRASDLYGRRRILMLCLVVFGAGSFVTATATTLVTTVVGRTLQGLGGGGLVPVTIAMVADIWTAEKRTLPLGIIGSVQELGSLLGPVWGAFIVAVTSWRAIFWINIPIVVGVGFLMRMQDRHGSTNADERPPDVVGWLLLCMAAVCAALALWSPEFLASSDVAGLLYAPVASGNALAALTTPIALAAWILTALFVTRVLTARPHVRPVVDLRALPRVLSDLDWAGAALIGGALGAIVIAFASTDPPTQVLSTGSIVLLVVAAAFASAFVVVERRNPTPLIPFAEFRDRAALGALCANLAVGAALVIALVDIPVFVRTTNSSMSQLDAAYILMRLLAAVPIGAIAGGVLAQRLGYRVIAGTGMLLCTVSLASAANWDSNVLSVSWLGVSWLHPYDPVLVLCGLGFGLAIAPINGAILQAVSDTLHGLASSLVVLARMIGMLTGVSLLTALGLHSFYVQVNTIASPKVLCPSSPGSCPQYDHLVEQAIISEMHTIFLGASVAAFLAAVICFATLRRRTRSASAPLVIAL